MARRRAQHLEPELFLLADLKAAVDAAKLVVLLDEVVTGQQQTNLGLFSDVALQTENADVSILVEKPQEGGSNNIAELLAVKEALAWAVAHKHDEIEIRTDSTNNLAWVLGTRVGKKINDRDAVLALKSSIDSLKSVVKCKLVHIPRSQNKAGHYIENKCRL